jgi:deazaflavin-dependent oxidoreductase (nitroreductase family)
MWVPILIVVGALLVVLGAVGLVFVFGLRAKSPRVRSGVRHFNHAIVNPIQLKSAGAPGAYASVIRHRGRTSGRSYETPVGAVPTEDGFVIATVYGTESDWLKNVLANGTATIVHEGVVTEVDRPELVRMDDVAAWFPAKEQRAHRRFRVDQALRVRRVRVEQPLAA